MPPGVAMYAYWLPPLAPELLYVVTVPLTGSTVVIWP
jgi:hypothetical protein